MLIVGLAGGIATGKTELAKRFAEYGAVVIQADDLSRELVVKGSAAWREIVEAFGENVLDDEGEIQRERVADLVFADAKQRRRLNRIMHPKMAARIRERLKELATEGERDIVVLEAAILEEMGLLSLVDRLVVTTCSAGEQVARLRAKGWSEEKAKRRIQAQAGRASLHKKADWVVSTEGERSHLAETASALWNEIIGSQLPKPQ